MDHDAINVTTSPHLSPARPTRADNHQLDQSHTASVKYDDDQEEILNELDVSLLICSIGIGLIGQADMLEDDITEPSPEIERRTTTFTSSEPFRIHTSSSQIFDPAPGLFRHTTYSSLPPTPVGEPDDLGHPELRNGGLDDISDRMNHKAEPKDGKMRTGAVDLDDGRADYDVPEHVPSSGEQERRWLGSGLWDLFMDEVGAEDWDGWVAEAKSYVPPFSTTIQANM